MQQSNQCIPSIPIMANTVDPDQMLQKAQMIYNMRKEPPLQKYAYSNILRILPPKIENFQTKNSDIFHISAQNIGCVYSLELP